jgi:hypothetical protein
MQSRRQPRAKAVAVSQVKLESFLAPKGIGSFFLGDGAAAAEPPAEASGAKPTLHLLFNGQRYRVDKEKFVIGRGSQQTDLTIRDGNISRKHCAVIFRGGQFFIKDLDSTNGIEFNGKRIEHKRIEEGDTFFLCDYELKFTYR